MTAQPEARPHVLMLLTARAPFGTDWARAAAQVAQVTTAGIVDSYDAVEYDSAPEHLLLRRRWRPERLLHEVELRYLAGQAQELLTRLGREGRPVDLVHGHFYSSSAFLPRLHRRTGVPYVVSEHSSRLRRTTDAVTRKRATLQGRRRARLVFSSASKVLAVGDALATDLLEQALTRACTVVPNPVDTRLFRPDADGAPVRLGAPRLVSTGRLEHDKGLDLIIEAVADLRRSHPDVRLVIHGDGPQREPLAALAAQLGVAEQVLFTGRVSRDDLVRSYSTSDVYVSGSRIETFGMAAYEALAAGLRVVAAPALGGLLPIAEAPGSCVTGADSDPQSLASAIRAVLQQPRPEWAGHAWVERRYGSAAVGEALRRVYAEASRSL